MAEVVVVGSYNAALTIYGERLPVRGETIIGDRFEQGPGGKGANQAIGAKRLGADVVFVTTLGTDTFGDDAERVLTSEGLPAKGILRSSGRTGVALILVDGHGDNLIGVAPGANLELNAADVVDRFEDELADCRFLLFQLECTSELAIEVGAWGRRRGICTILNPAPAKALSHDALASFDVLTPNETELAALAGAMGADGSDIEAAAEALVAAGAANVVTTLGQEGALWATARGIRRFPSYAVPSVDATGAGDAFNAALVAALASGTDLATAIDYGCRAGAYCVTRRGVIDGLPTHDEIGEPGRHDFDGGRATRATPFAAPR